MQHVTGMVQVAGTTYRIVRMGRGVYEVIRILDDSSVGTFECGRPLAVSPRGIASAELRQIASTAVRCARTSWRGSDAAAGGAAAQ